MSNLINDLFSVKGLVAVITGGGSGLGLYAAKALAANGAAAVYIVGRREATLKEAASNHNNIIPIVGDVTDKASLQAVAERVRKEQGYVNFLFANAGVSGPKARDYLPTLAKGGKPTIEELQKGMWEPEMDFFSQTYHVNSSAVYYTAVAFLDLLDAGNKKKNVPQESQIVVTSSVAGFSRHLASSFAYSTSKAAANHMVKMLSTFFAQQGHHIRCNLIAPGLYPSEMTQGTVSSLETVESDMFKGAHKMAPENCPAGRTGSEQDMAGAVLFLASPAGAYLNGETMVSDGGRMSQLPATY
ncbi:uncharacterized protein LTR77_010475 [Saxophila tyrrhenica]|uniref:NAD(P)-binding protein n=1 Tax=Saxophila tyrrhenica TaxID=1690608 RepID=A0AAV9NY33_9PEZI|nr:hypothetical protein LTR77_010475 [Saxophila tyrrhenica]